MFKKKYVAELIHRLLTMQKSSLPALQFFS